MRELVNVALICTLCGLIACDDSATNDDAGAGKSGGTGGTGDSGKGAGGSNGGGKGGSGSGGKSGAGGSGDMCSQRAQQASTAVQAAADKADLTCTANADCEVISNSTDCFASCGVLVSARGKGDVQAAIDALDKGMCKSFEADGCEVVIPPCVPPDEFSCSAGRCRWRGDTAGDGGAQPEQDAAVQGDGGATTPGCLARAVTWGSDGGLVSRRDSFAIEPCRDFSMTRMELRNPDDDVTCQNEIAGSTSVDDVNAAIAHADVAAAIAAAVNSGEPVLYGSDSRPVDGTVFRMQLGKAVIDVGGDCSGGVGVCKDIPPGIGALRTLLLALAEQQMKLPDCDAVAP